MAKINQLVNFDFDSSCDHIELNFDFPQESPSTGWSIEPHVQPSKVSHCTVLILSSVIRYIRMVLIVLMKLFFLHLVWYQFVDHLMLYQH